MPEHYDNSPRKRPRRRSRSPSPIMKRSNHDSRRRLNYKDDDRKYDRREARGNQESPSPTIRHPPRRSEEDHRRRIKYNDPSDSMSHVPRRHGKSCERRKHLRYHSESRSSSPRHRRHDSRSPPPRHRRLDSFSPPSGEYRPTSREHRRSHDRKLPPCHKDDHSSTLAPSSRSKAPLPSQQAAFTGISDTSNDAVTKPDANAEKQKPNYAPSGLLAAETNTVTNTNIVLKYNEPPESRLPPSSQPWRLYIFKNKDLLDTISLHTRPCWLFGRETAVCDIAVEHPSASKQHAVLQFRYLEKAVGEFGEKKGKVGLYILDLDSANGTKLNGEGLPGRRFVECRSGDMVQFGESTREYVVLLPPKG